MESKQLFRIGSDGKSYFGTPIAEVAKPVKKEEAKDAAADGAADAPPGEDVVTGIEVVAVKETGIDYDKLIEKFGCSKITEE